RDELLRCLARLKPGPGKIPFYSSVTGRVATGPELDAGYWWDNVRRPVAFAAAAEQLAVDGHTVFLEIGPHPVLRHYLTECLPEGAAIEGGRCVVAAPLRRGEPELAALLRGAGALYAAGCAPDWSRVNPGGGRLVELPRYPWQRGRHWHEPRRRL